MDTLFPSQFNWAQVLAPALREIPEDLEILGEEKQYRQERRFCKIYRLKAANDDSPLILIL
jgi:hypothetical protein